MNECLLENSHWRFDAHAFEQLSELVHVISPSMDERAMGACLRRLWTEAGGLVDTDVMGNVHAVINRCGYIHVGLVAHMDTVAVQITQILSNGLMRFRSIGLNPHVLLGQAVCVRTEDGVVDGVIGFDPTSQYGQPKGLVTDDLWLDIGAGSYEEAAAKVSVGDLAVLTPVLRKTDGGLLCGTGLDDRIGLLAVTECMKAFKDCLHPAICLHAIGTVQEEVGLRGAGIVASWRRLDACLVVDVDYATDTLTPHENQMGTLQLGKGVGVHVKSDNSPVLRKVACEAADRRGIPYQKSVGRFLYGGTDASSLQLQGGGVAVMNVNIPCRYMHSPVEMCHVSDVESAVAFLQSALHAIGNRGQADFIPL